MKKLLTLLLSLVLILSVIPMSALTANAETYSGKCGENLTWSLDTETGVLDITGTGDMNDYYYDSKAPWYSYRDSIETVNIADTVTSIGHIAFYECSSLTEITIPDSVTSIGRDAFYGCSNLKTVNNYSVLPIVKGSSAIGYAGYYADTVNWYVDNVFGTCGDNLTWSLDFETGVLNITGTGEMRFDDYLFYGSEIVPSPPWDIYYQIIKTVNIAEGVTNIENGAFIGNSLTEITIPNSVTQIGIYAFDSCKILKIYNYSNLKITKGSTANGYIGYNADFICNCIGSLGTNIEYSFEPTTGALKITGTGMMNNYLSVTDTPWYGCRTDIKKIEISDGIINIGDYAFADCTDLTSVTFGKDVSSIGRYTFYNCSSLTEITIPDSVESIETNAFLGCTNLIIKAHKKAYAYQYAENKNIEVQSLCSPDSNVWYDGGREHYHLCVCGEKLNSAEHTYDNDCDTTCNICNEVRTVSGHSYDNDCDTTCNIYNEVRAVAGHSYDNDCDTTCNICNAKRTVGAHKYTTTTTKATTSKDGKIVKKCSVCGATTTTTIKKIKTVKLSATSYTYNGKTKKPSVSVKDSAGKTISSSNYTVSYQSGRKNVGKYKVTIKFKGNYSGSKTLYFTIKPVKTTVKSITAGKKQLKVNITKKSTQVTGYQIQYSLNKNFKSAKTTTVKSYKTTSATIKSLKAKKTYYVRVRTFKTVGKTKYYSDWSSAKSKKTK